MTVALWDLIIETAISSIPLLFLIVIFLYLGAGFASLKSNKKAENITAASYLEHSLKALKQHNQQLERYLKDGIPPEPPHHTAKDGTQDTVHKKES